MLPFIKLTSVTGEPWSVRLDRIESFESIVNGGCLVTTMSGTLESVKEDGDAVEAAILNVAQRLSERVDQ